jgi:hypothetical protein
MPDRYLNGIQIDPAYEQEIAELISTPSKAERAYAAWEDTAEFMPGWRLDESDERDANEVFHDHYRGTVWA